MIKANDWVKVDRWPMAPIMGQIITINTETATIINFHGTRQVRVADIIETFDPLAMYANNPQGVPAFITERLALTT